MTPSDIIIALLGSGMALSGAAAYFALLAHRLRRSFQTMIELDCRDPLAWPQEAWRHLQYFGVRGLIWQGEWLGTPVSGHLGRFAKADWESTFRLDYDLALHTQADLGRARKGERQWLARAGLSLF
ncbi:MAG: hypothetical protein ACK4N6_00280, partial [Rhodocyclaceae bacterium]